MPALTARGGITNYYQVLKEEFPVNIEYFERGSRTWPYRKGFLKELVRAFNDYKKFKLRLSQGDIDILQTSTSLSLSTTIRDGLFVKYANKKGIKTIVFFRGWDKEAAQKIRSILFLFKHFIFRADNLITLSEDTKNILIEWGYRNKIYVETTLVDRSLLNNISEDAIIQKHNRLKRINTFQLLFFSRVENRKGIFELLDAFSILNNDAESPVEYKLTICGDGFELERVKSTVYEENLRNIEIMGFLEGERKKHAFENAHILIFPSHGEGMPNAVLEAMGFGIPVITTPVGGIVDFFEDGKNGFYIKQNNPMDIVDKVNMLTADMDRYLDICINNYRLAMQSFRSDIVAKRMQRIFNNTMNN